MKMVALSVAGFGIFGCLPVFWTFPAAFLSGAAAAGGIALINSIGNLAGFAGPYAMGSIKDMTGSYTGGLLSLSAVGLIAMAIVLALHTITRIDPITSRARRMALIGGRERQHPCRQPSFVAVDVEPDTRRRKEFVRQPAAFHEP
jgi:nitrate/nitrite transporter NarK